MTGQRGRKAGAARTNAVRPMGRARRYQCRGPRASKRGGTIWCGRESLTQTYSGRIDRARLGRDKMNRRPGKLG